jgi:hypothetical protein
VITLEDAIAATGVDVLDHLDRSAEVPILSGLQRQGDVAVIPHSVGRASVGDPIPPNGIPVVRGESGGNTHALVADGPCFWRPTDSRGQDLGVVTVSNHAVCYLAHPEHGFLGIGPGSYLVRRQREQAEEIRLVQD